MSTDADDTGETHQIDPIDALRAANPVPGDSTARAHNSVAAQALFEEITMTDPMSTTGPDAARLTRRRPATRRLWMTAGAAAAAAALVFGGVVLRPGSGNSAAADVLRAAEATADAGSGTVVLSLDGTVDGEPIDLDVTTHFWDDDVELTFVVAPSDAAPGITQTIRSVDGVSYVRFDGADGGWFRTGMSDAEDMLAGMGLPATLDLPTGDGLVGLLRDADDFTEVGDGRYRATSTVGAVRGLDPIPAGLALVAADDSQLADGQVIEIVVQVGADGFIRELTVSFDGVDEQGSTADVTIHTAYRDLGQGSPVEAPADAADIATRLLDDPEMTAAVAVLDDLEQRRPGLCTEVLFADGNGPDGAEPGAEPNTELGEEVAEVALEAYTTCLREAGEPEAADAFTTLTEFPG